MESRKKTFDCVAMKRRGAAAVRRATEGMTPEQELAYWQRGTQDLLELQKKLRAESSRPQAAAKPSPRPA